MTSAGIHLADFETWQDIATFCSRARAASPDPALRFVGFGQVLAVYASVRPATGSTLVVGLRTVALASPWKGDLTCSAAAWSDRLHAQTADNVLPVPPTTVPGAADLAQSPPRGGWQPSGQVALTELQQACADVESQAATWDSPVLTATTSESIVAGAAVTAQALGMVPSASQRVALAVGGPDLCSVRTSGRWLRIDCPGGFVLSRTAIT